MTPNTMQFRRSCSPCLSPQEARLQAHTAFPAVAQTIGDSGFAGAAGLVEYLSRNRQLDDRVAVSLPVTAAACASGMSRLSCMVW